MLYLYARLMCAIFLGAILSVLAKIIKGLAQYITFSPMRFELFDEHGSPGSWEFLSLCKSFIISLGRPLNTWNNGSIVFSTGMIPCQRILTLIPLSVWPSANNSCTSIPVSDLISWFKLSCASRSESLWKLSRDICTSSTAFFRRDKAPSIAGQTFAYRRILFLPS